jgi:hypothetical protein
VSKFCISRIFPSFKSSTLKKYRARCSLVFPHTPTRNHVLTQGLKVQVKKKGRLKTNRRSSGTHQTAHATEGRDRTERNLLRLVYFFQLAILPHVPPPPSSSMPPAVRPCGEWREDWIFGTCARSSGRNTEWGAPRATRARAAAWTGERTRRIPRRRANFNLGRLIRGNLGSP